MDMNHDEYKDEDYIDNLELLIQKANKYHSDGKDLIHDAIYDTCVDLLMEFKPDSDVLAHVWSEDAEEVFDSDWDSLLITHPMKSIRTVKGYDDKFFSDFSSSVQSMCINSNKIDLHASYKENGHGVRAVYSYGELMKATSRGRSTTGRDITKQFGVFAPSSIPELANYELVEIRGEVLLSFENYEKAKVYNPNLKSAFTGVASMIRASATEDESKLLNFVAYDIMGVSDFNTLQEKYQYLEKCGFEVPYYTVTTVDATNLIDEVKAIMDKMAEVIDSYPYYTDGVVVSVNNLTLFNIMGAEEKYNNGNVAMKVGRWEQNVYNGVVDHIEWRPGKIKFTPVAVLEGDGVMTGTGNRVKNVPMYAPLYLLLVDAYPGNTIHFKYGGEAGVVPCTMDGRLLTSFSQEEILGGFSAYATKVLDDDYDPDTDLSGYDV